MSLSRKDERTIRWCYCGLILQEKMGVKVCEKHGIKFTKIIKQRIERYSGPTKRMKGAYELF